MPPDPSCRRLMLLTNAVENAVKAEDWDEVEVILAERGQIIDGIVEASELIDPDTLRQLKRADDRLHQALALAHSQIATELRAAHLGSVARTRYQATSPLEGYDLAS